MRYLGWAFLGLVVVVLLAGPELAPYSPTKPVGAPYLLPGEHGLLGTDQLGRDVASRMLHGGRPLLLTSLISALVGTLLGAVLGIASALTPRGWLRALMLRPLDAVAAVPPILLLLLVLVASPNRIGIVLAVVVVSVPLSARVARAAAVQVVGRAHVEAAVSRGEPWIWLAGREVLPLIAGTLLADAGVRFVSAVYLVAAAGFLGLTTSDSDWGLLIVDAFPGVALQPWALLAPVLGVAFLAVSANLASDGLARRSRGILA